MNDDLLVLGTVAAEVDPGVDELNDLVDRAIRASLLCVSLGLEREAWVLAFDGGAGRPPVAGTRSPAAMLTELYEVLGGVGYLATVGGAADLDPMDLGPSHTALPATLASCQASLCSGRLPGDGAEDAIREGVLAGIEVALRVRRAVTGARPGVGFHSPGVFGCIAAAAAASRTLGLAATETANAIGIALSRASGLAINSAATEIGLTHFGWGSVHGLEAALLAAEGWAASHDLGRALETLFATGEIDCSAVAAGGTRATLRASQLMFKHYPCNIYLNLVAMSLRGVTDVDRIEIDMPWIPHLDNQRPNSIRQVRNSAQGVAAIVIGRGTSYAAFSGEGNAWQADAKIEDLLDCVTLKMDKSRTTNLAGAEVRVRAWSGTKVVVDRLRSTRELTPWGEEHAKDLLEGSEVSTEELYQRTVGHVYTGLQERWKRR